MYHRKVTDKKQMSEKEETQRTNVYGSLHTVVLPLYISKLSIIHRDP